MESPKNVTPTIDNFMEDSAFYEKIEEEFAQFNKQELEKREKVKQQFIELGIKPKEPSENREKNITIERKIARLTNNFYTRFPEGYMREALRELKPDYIKENKAEDLARIEAYEQLHSDIDKYLEQMGYNTPEIIALIKNNNLSEDDFKKRMYIVGKTFLAMKALGYDDYFLWK